MNPLHILHLEDSRKDAELIRAILDAEGIACDVLRVDTRDGFVAALERGGFDLILGDYSLPSFDGMSALKITLEKSPDVPFIFVSAILGEELAIEAVKNGASDYVLKQNLQRLGASVQRAMREMEESTERKQAEEALRESNNFNDSLIQTIPLGLDIVDEQGNILFLNPAMEAAVGKQANGKPCWHLYKDDRQQCADCPLKQPIQVGKTLVLESAGALGGKTFEISHTGINYRGKKALLEVFYDITERKRAGEALHEAQIRYRTLFEQSPDGVLIVDPETALPIEFNDTTHRQLGYSRDEFARLRVSDYEALEQPEETNARIAKVLREGRGNFETRHRTKQGEIRNILVTVQTLELSGRSLFHCIFRDITERKRAEEKVARNLARIRALHEIDKAITSTLDLRTVLDILLEKIDLSFPYPTASTVRLLNKESGALDAIACRNIDEEEWKKTENQGDVAFRAHTVIETKAPFIVRNLITDPRTQKSNEYLKRGLVSYLGIPLIVHNKALGVLSFYTKDEHEFTDEEIDFLTTLAGQAAIAIHNSQLFEQIKRQAQELEVSNKVKDEFLGIMSHELRTPLNVVMGYTSMVLDNCFGEINPEQAAALEKVLKHSNELLALLNRLLVATQISGSRLGANKSLLDLNESLDRVKLAHADLTSINVVLEWEYPKESVQIYTDAEKLEQILKELIDNALKFTESGRITISVQHVTEEQAIQCRIADTGIGIPEERIPVIFEIFHQLDTSDTRPYDGTGLGLYIANAFTRLLGGKIAVESELGKGSTFTVTIPYTT